MVNYYFKTITSFFLFFGSSIYAQNLVSYDELRSLNVSSKNEMYHNAYTLITELQPKVYIRNGIEKNSFQKTVTSCEVDMFSYKLIFDKDYLSQIEILTIKIHKNDIQKLDLQYLTSKFNQLKYVYLIIDYATDKNNIVNYLGNIPNHLLVVYNVSIPD
jgi:CRISPR/Cas system endoribonuclease Cas6 (RAMP superfamily)